MLHAYVCVGLGYGDEGKGSWVDHLVRKHEIRYVVRYNGGAQAAHHVVTPDGRMHVFAQFGSGSFVPGTFTLLSRFMLIEPIAIINEAKALELNGVANPLGLLIVSENAPVIGPFNLLLNRMQELYRGQARHGSCGLGIGATQQDVEQLGSKALYVRDLKGDALREKLLWLHRQKLQEAEQYLTTENAQVFEALRDVDIEYYVERYKQFATSTHIVNETEFGAIIRQNDTVFEGAQGVLLDQCFGFFPYCTRSNTTFENANALLREAGFSDEVVRVGLLRGYSTRHGAGPLVTQDPALVVPQCHNQTNEWQGRFRLGWFDAVATRYALEVLGGVDILAITNLDRMAGLERIKVATSYQNADERYFTDTRILMPRVLTSERTDALSNVIPGYSEFQGWKGDCDKKHVERYLEALSGLLPNPVSAYSLSATHEQKVYLQ